MNLPASDAAILFADVSGSTRLYHALGDRRARVLIGGCLILMKRAVEAHGGRVVKTIGDEVMALFPSGADAGAAAVAMQEAVAAEPWPPEGRLSIHAGLQTGAVVEEEGDVYGDAVNVAAFLTKEAKSGQIFTSCEAWEAMTAGGFQAVTRQVGEAAVKGRADPVVMVELLWGEEGEMTVLGGGTFSREAQSAGLFLYVEGREFYLSESRPRISLGRAAENDIVVADPKVSRAHAMIELRKGRFFLMDRSSNGTFLAPDEGGAEEAMALKREEAELSGAGVIGLGRKVEPGDHVAIRYQEE